MLFGVFYQSRVDFREYWSLPCRLPLRQEGETMVGTARFELATSRTPSVRATRLRYVPTGELTTMRRGTAGGALPSVFFPFTPAPPFAKPPQKPQAHPPNPPR